MPTDRELLEQMFSRISGLSEALRQTVSDHLWAIIPESVFEAAYSASLATGAANALMVTPQVDGLVMITALVCAVPSGATGNVQLGSAILPVGPGVTNVQGLSVMVDRAATRSLAIATSAGPAALWLCGQQRPTYARMAP